jgi:hypothetical protein
VASQKLPSNELSPSRDPFGVIAVRGHKMTVWHNGLPQILSTTLSKGESGLASSNERSHKAEPARITFSRFEVAPQLEFASAIGAPMLHRNTFESAGLKLQHLAQKFEVLLTVSSSGLLQLTKGSQSRFLSGCGASTLLDIDGDGSAEIFASSSETGFEDAFRISTIDELMSSAKQNFEDMPNLFHEAIKGRVTGATAFDSDGDGLDEVYLSLALFDGTGALMRLAVVNSKKSKVR